MDDLQKFLDLLSFRATKKLLVDLAIHFSDQTKRVAVPPGTTVYSCEIFSESLKDGLTTKKIRIPLIPFFGMYVGYNSELDILVFEEPKS
jgi:hypothetical protein